MRKSLSILGLTAGLVILAQPVMADTWGPESTYYKNIKRATGSGNFYNDGNVRAANDIKVVDEASDGNRVYGVTEFLFRQYDCEVGDCKEDFYSKDTKTTEEFQNDTRHYAHKVNLEPRASQVRVKTFACVQMGWPVPDGCAAAAYPGFSY